MQHDDPLRSLTPITLFTSPCSPHLAIVLSLLVNRALEAFEALGYARSRVHDGGAREFQFIAKRCLAAADGDHERVPAILVERAVDYLANTKGHDLPVMPKPRIITLLNVSDTDKKDILHGRLSRLVHVFARECWEEWKLAEQQLPIPLQRDLEEDLSDLIFQEIGPIQERLQGADRPNPYAGPEAGQ